MYGILAYVTKSGPNNLNVREHINDVQLVQNVNEQQGILAGGNTGTMSTVRAAAAGA